MLLVTGLIMVGAVLTNKSPVTLAQVTPIARLTGEYEVLVVPAASPYRTLGEFIKAWKANPGLPIAGGSAGGTDHMLTGLLAAAAGVDVTRMNYVPHSGGGETIASLVGNQVPAGVNGLAEFTSLIAAGRLRALAISSEKRLPGIDIPTFVEQGVKPDAGELARRHGGPQHHPAAACRADLGRGTDAPVARLENARARRTTGLTCINRARRSRRSSKTRMRGRPPCSNRSVSSSERTEASSRPRSSVLGLLLLAGVRGIAPGAGYDRIGPRFFPIVTATGMILLGAVLAISARRRRPPD